jgi:hypothetical protein
MTRRRFQLLGSRAGEIASNTVRSFPESAIVMASGAMAAGAYLFGRAGAKPGAAPR